jgi:hypothetical protein
MTSAFCLPQHHLHERSSKSVLKAEDIKPLVIVHISFAVVLPRDISVRPETKMGGDTNNNLKLRETLMQRRELLKYAGATVLAAPFIRTARADQGSIKVGVVGAKTGPLAPGAATTFFPHGNFGQIRSTRRAA